MEENQVIQLCKAGHNQYFDLLVEMYEKTLYKYCYYLTGNKNETEDLFQDTWIKVFEKLYSYDESYSFKNWILSISTNTYRDRYRKLKRWSKKQVTNNDTRFDNEPSNEQTPEEQLFENENFKQLHVAISQLKVHHRSVIILHYFEEMSIEEISTILNIPKGTVKSRLNQARKILQEKVGESNETR